MFRGRVLGAVVIVACTICAAASSKVICADELPTSVKYWSLNSLPSAATPASEGSFALVGSGSTEPAAGVVGGALRFDEQCLRVASASDLQFADTTFSLTAWVNSHFLGGQQMIVAKNAYSEGKREWGVMIDNGDRFAFYLWNRGWKKIVGQTAPKLGHWYHVAATVDKGHARLYVNGRLEAEAKLVDGLTPTDAPVSIGGVFDNGRLTQAFHGALDEVAIYNTALSAEVIGRLADQKPAPHLLQSLEPKPLWSGAMPNSADVPVLRNVRFSVIKPYEPKVDGGQWLLGVALAWHKGGLYASYGFNKGGENTAGEEARGRISRDGGRTWGEGFTIDRGGDNMGVSHGVFLSHRGTLWAFHGAFYDRFQRTHTRAYTLDESSGKWQARGIVVEGGFWPLQEPLRLPDGNWIMAGARVAHGLRVNGSLPAVAISRGDDLTHWDLVVIPAAQGLPIGTIWGESSVVVEGNHLLNVSRWGRPLALAAESDDAGRTWTPAQATNLPMAATKPYTGRLSTGAMYLVSTTTADCGNRRSPLTIAIGAAGSKTFCKVFVIRHAVFAEGPGPSDANAQLCYPYAVEHEGHLYVGYSVKNHRTAELAIIPLGELR